MIAGRCADVNAGGGTGSIDFNGVSTSKGCGACSSASSSTTASTGGHTSAIYGGRSGTNVSSAEIAHTCGILDTSASTATEVIPLG